MPMIDVLKSLIYSGRRLGVFFASYRFIDGLGVFSQEKTAKLV